MVGSTLFLVGIFCHKPKIQPEGHGRRHLRKCEKKSEGEQGEWFPQLWNPCSWLGGQDCHRNFTWIGSAPPEWQIHCRALPVFDLFPNFNKYLKWHIMLWVVGGRGSREMNWPQFLTSIPEAFTLAPSPLIQGAWPKQNLKPKAFIISVLKNTLNKRKKNKGRKEKPLFDSVLSFTNTHLNLKLPQIQFQEKSKLYFIDQTSLHPDLGTTRNPVFTSPVHSFLHSTCQCRCIYL